MRKPGSRSAEVIVVGGGLAGLTAATVVAAAGVASVTGVLFGAAGSDGAIHLWTSDGGGIRRCAQSARSAG